MVTAMFDNVDTDLEDNDFFKFIKEKIGVKASYICLAVLLTICVLALFDIAADIITSFFGMLYPPTKASRYLFLHLVHRTRNSRIKERVADLLDSLRPVDFSGRHFQFCT
jgi:hypothetical protein